MFNLGRIYKFLFLSKWKILPPKKNNFVLVDGEYNPFLKYISKNQFTILYRRGEEINFFILAKCILKFKFSTLDYCKEFIKSVSPKLILTAFDYHSIFYRLSKETGIKTLMLQKGKRSKIDQLMIIKNNFFSKKSINSFFVDYILVYNQFVKKFYSKLIAGKYYEIGSFENNFKRIKVNPKKEILFISNYNISDDGKVSYKTENEDLIARKIYLLAKKNKIKFNILPRNRKNPQKLISELEYYKKNIKGTFGFLKLEKKSGYDVLSNYKYIFSTYSTMGIEAMARDSRVGFIFCKSYKNPIYNLWFGSFENLKKKGPFWITMSKLNEHEIQRVFNFVTKSSNLKWKNIIKKYKYLLMKFDEDNKIFKKILKKEIKWNF